MCPYFVVGVKKSASINDPRKSYIFRADHPFIYFIEDKQSEITLFIGRYI